jgi:hypothetical protein
MSKWRDKTKVHPASDVFPMMTDDELKALGDDIKANGLKHPILFHCDGTPDFILIDGRNRYEAMERAGLPLPRPRASVFDSEVHITPYDNPVSEIITLNIHRRHLTKQQQADLIVAALKAGEAPRQLEEVPKRHVKGKAGSEKDPLKTKAVAAGKAHGISKSTVERSLAKAEGKTPKPRAKEHSVDNTEIETEPGTDDDTWEVEYPAQVRINALGTIQGSKAVAESYRKIFKKSSFDLEVKQELHREINLLIAKWRRVQSTLGVQQP